MDLTVSNPLQKVRNMFCPIRVWPLKTEIEDKGHNYLLSTPPSLSQRGLSQWFHRGDFFYAVNTPSHWQLSRMIIKHWATYSLSEELRIRNWNCEEKKSKGHSTFLSRGVTMAALPRVSLMQHTSNLWWPEDENSMALSVGNKKQRAEWNLPDRFKTGSDKQSSRNTTKIDRSRRVRR